MNAKTTFDAAAPRLRAGPILILSLIGLCAVAQAQTATVSGDLFAFDVVNTSGVPAHGFELQIEGALPADIYYSDASSRYGVPTIVPYATGVYVRWQANYNSATGQYDQSTPVNSSGSFAWQDCYQGGTGYPTSGCEHFGQSTYPTGSTVLVTTGRWMQDNPAHPGTLIAVNPPAPVPFPSWTTGFGAGASIVTAVVEAPEPPETPETYGDAQWIKIYQTQLTRSVVETDLNTTNPAVVPIDPSQLEVSWDIIQASPPSNGNGGKNRGSKSNSGNLKVDTRSVIRRYELYQYTGVYDATTHQVVCADTTCTAPSTGELGNFLSAQNSATNVIADSLTVKRAGSGTGTVTGAGISCGNLCSAFLNSGTVATLTAAPASGKAFGGWTGGCTGSQLTCTVTVSGQVTVTATFKSQHTVSVSKSNSSNGTVTATPAGNDKTISCGKTCSAKFTDGTVVTLTAVPVTGKTFTSWTNGCTGASKTCTITVSKDTAIQANFSK